MQTNIIMRKPGIYVPEKKVYNDYYLRHFNCLGKTCEGLLRHMGRRKRYLGDESETSITMTLAAARSCLKSNKMVPEELDVLVFASDMPERLVPNNASKLTWLLKASNVKFAFDFNTNCSSMLNAIEVTRHYMLANPEIKNALIVSCFLPSMFAKEDDTVTYANFGDAATALILTREESEAKRGFLDAETAVDAEHSVYIKFPKCGIKKLITTRGIPIPERKMDWRPFNSKFIAERWTELAQKMFKRNNLNPDDVNYFVFSALSDADNVKTLNSLGIDENSGKYFFFGTEYGYTGCTCQGLCLYRMWDTFAVEGNTIAMFTVGAGISYITQLYRF